jgi:hypothetical protein
MYANLLVKVESRPEPISAYKVITTDAEIVVYEDLQNGNGSYYEEGPEHRFPLGERVTVGADFWMPAYRKDDRGVIEVLDVGRYNAARTGTDVVTCGACGRSWDDAVVTSWTPAPSGRCPFEDDHEDEPEMGGSFKLTIEMGNAAMSTPADVGRALEKVAGGLVSSGWDGIESGRIRDENGNTVGSWSVADPPEDPYCEECGLHVDHDGHLAVCSHAEE